MSSRALHFIIPGDLQSATGGYVYDRCMISGLRALGWRVTVHRLDGSFPHPNVRALAHAERVLAALPDRACVLIDGLALGAMAELIETHSDRLTIIALMHALLGGEVGMATRSADRLRRQEQRALRSVHHVIVTGHATQRTLAACGIAAGRLSVVEPGTAQAAPARRGCHPPLALLCVATVSDGKGQGLLLEALAPLSGLDWHLTCVGSLTRSAETVRRLRDRLRQLGLVERVSLIGEVPYSALTDFYQAADLFVLATLRESYCMAVAEAVAHGLPVVGTHTGAIAELTGSDAGLLVAPGDRDALRAALERTMTEPELLQALGRGALAARSRLAPWPQASARMARLLGRISEHAQQHPHATVAYRMR